MYIPLQLYSAISKRKAWWSSRWTVVQLSMDTLYLALEQWLGRIWKWIDRRRKKDGWGWWVGKAEDNSMRKEAIV